MRSKDFWLPLTFYPIEDPTALDEMRDLMSPFMRAIKKCTKLSIKLSMSSFAVKDEREAVFDEIIRTASSDVDQKLLDKLHAVMARPGQKHVKGEHELLKNMNMRKCVLKT